MASSIDSAKRVINGTFGELWWDGIKVAEVISFTAKTKKNKEKVNFCGQFMTDYKARYGEGAGTITIHKVDSGFLTREIDSQDGVDHRYTVTTLLRDPDNWGAERIALYNVSLDDVTLADWQAATMSKVTLPFTYTRAKLLDVITGV